MYVTITEYTGFRWQTQWGFNTVNIRIPLSDLQLVHVSKEDWSTLFSKISRRKTGNRRVR